MTIFWEYFIINNLLIASLYCFIYLPKHIEALYYKDHFAERRRFSSIVGSITGFASIIFAIYAIHTEGIKSPFGFFFIVFFVILLIAILHTLYMRRFKNEKRLLIKNILYGKEGISEEIDILSLKYPGIKIVKSIAMSPMSISMKSNDEVIFKEIIELIKTENTIFKDLNQPMFRRRLYFFITLFILSIINSILFILWFFTQ